MPTFPGGTALSRLEVYPWEAVDGCHGGSPHVHTVCTEAYLVIGGRGELHTLTTHGVARHPLEPGTVAWFDPGTIHRAVNLERLRVVVLMENAGLPEAGDAVMTFPPDVLTDPERYRSAASLDPHDMEGSARRRRDLAVEGYLELVRSVREGDPGPLSEFYKNVGRLVRPHVSTWRDQVHRGPAAAVADSLHQIDRLAAGDVTHLLEASVSIRGRRGPVDRGFGMCGRLDVYEVHDGHGDR